MFSRYLADLFARIQREDTPLPQERRSLINEYHILWCNGRRTPCFSDQLVAREIRPDAWELMLKIRYYRFGDARGDGAVIDKTGARLMLLDQVLDGVEAVEERFSRFVQEPDQYEIPPSDYPLWSRPACQQLFLRQYEETKLFRDHLPPPLPLAAMTPAQFMDAQFQADLSKKENRCPR